MLVLVRNVEIFRHALTVMGADEVLDNLGQIVLFRQLDTVGDVTDDDLCTLFIAQALVRIDARLVFGEERRIHHLADVVIERTGADQLAVCTDTVGCFGS